MFQEQVVVDFIYEAGRRDSAYAARAFKGMAKGLKGDDQTRAIEIVSRYLFNPESPMYNSELYLAAIDGLLAGGVSDDADAVRLAAHHEMLTPNRVGKRAVDFSYETPDGQQVTLMQTVMRAPHTLLFFHDLDCTTCRAMEQAMAASAPLADAVATGQLTVLMIEPFDNERAEWRRHAAQMPAGWVAGRAEGLDERGDYFMPRTPTIYLLDRNGRVVVRDMSDGQFDELIVKTGDF